VTKFILGEMDSTGCHAKWLATIYAIPFLLMPEADRSNGRVGVPLRRSGMSELDLDLS